MAEGQEWRWSDRVPTQQDRDRHHASFVDRESKPQGEGRGPGCISGCYWGGLGFHHHPFCRGDDYVPLPTREELILTRFKEVEAEAAQLREQNERLQGAIKEVLSALSCVTPKGRYRRFEMVVNDAILNGSRVLDEVTQHQGEGEQGCGSISPSNYRCALPKGHGERHRTEDLPGHWW
jgi:hypothetical protein